MFFLSAKVVSRHLYLVSQYFLVCMKMVFLCIKGIYMRMYIFSPFYLIFNLVNYRKTKTMLGKICGGME